MNTFKIAAATIAFAISSQVFAGPVNINQADALELDKELLGVGPAIAQRIVDYRESKGAFTETAQLTQVKGIGEKTLSKNAEFILLK
ncbi:MAG: ComEA family DNA-binding protein [Oceanococcus sp.]